MIVKLSNVIKRIFRNNIMDAVFGVILSSFFLVNAIGIEYYAQLNLIYSYNNTPYNKCAIHFFFVTDDDNFSLEWLQESKVLKDCVLFKYNQEVKGLYNVIYCDVNAVTFEEENITKWDWNSKEPKIVVGCDAKYSIGDKIFRSDKSYPVVGIIQKHASEAVNSGVFYTDNNLSMIDTQYRYILTAPQNNIIEDRMESFIKILSENNISIKRIEVKDSEFDDYVNYKVKMKNIILFFVLFDILFICLSTLSWMKVKHSHSYVRNLLGEKNVKIKMVGKYIFIWLLSFTIGVIIKVFLWSFK